jgi:outer membrane lipoprotein-sorting protein
MGGFYQIARIALVGLVALGAACAPKPIALPSGSGTPFAGAAEAFASATANCRDVRSVTAELGLSGRVGGTKLRGRAIVGLAAPDRIRLEALAPFGPPVFVLASQNGSATLLLPRDDRVLRDEPPEAIVEALAGVRLDPASLRGALAGCGVESSAASGGRTFNGSWAAVDLEGDRTVYLQKTSAGWLVRGAETKLLTITYDEMTGMRPARITIRSRAGDLQAEVRLRVSQLEMNPALGDEVFTIDVPDDADPLTLGELREAGPLGERTR